MNSQGSKKTADKPKLLDPNTEGTTTPAPKINGSSAGPDAQGTDAAASAEALTESISRVTLEDAEGSSAPAKPSAAQDAPRTYASVTRTDACAKQAPKARKGSASVEPDVAASSQAEDSSEHQAPQDASSVTASVSRQSSETIQPSAPACSQAKPSSKSQDSQGTPESSAPESSQAKAASESQAPQDAPHIYAAAVSRPSVDTKPAPSAPETRKGSASAKPSAPASSKAKTHSAAQPRQGSYVPPNRRGNRTSSRQGDPRGDGNGYFNRQGGRSSAKLTWGDKESSDAMGSSRWSRDDDPFAEMKDAGLLNGMNMGINFDKYADIPVEMSGNNCVEPIKDFDSSGLHDRLIKNIKLAKYAVPTPVQNNAAAIIMAKRDLMACAQTGSGKTAAFLLPTLHCMLEMGGPPTPSRYRRRTVHPTALVIAPTRELVSQIETEAKKFCHQTGVLSCAVYGGTDKRKQNEKLGKGADIIVATPGRLIDTVDRGFVSLECVRFLILDEADRMLDMGFEPQIRAIVEEFNLPSKEHRQTLMFSATFPDNIQRLASDFLNDYIFLSVGRVGSTNEFIVQSVEYVDDRDKEETLLHALGTVEGLTLVFVETKRRADQLEDFLLHNNFPATSIHGDRSQPEREHALKSFRSGRTPIIVATDVASRGLDIPNVAHVINFDLPGDIDDYVHRIGRTGRAGNSGFATAFMNNRNSNLARSLIELLAEAKQEVPQFLVEMNQYASRGGGAGRRNNRYGGRDCRRARGGVGSSGYTRNGYGSGAGYGGGGFGGDGYGEGGYGGGSWRSNGGSHARGSASNNQSGGGDNW